VCIGVLLIQWISVGETLYQRRERGRQASVSALRVRSIDFLHVFWLSGTDTITAILEKEST
jgi:hypothetical protein